jgi:hypothetical protein
MQVPPPQTAQQRAQAALLLAKTEMNNRTPQVAIQQCVLNQFEQEANNPTWQQGQWNQWPTPKADMYLKMSEELKTTGGFNKQQDKQLLDKFITEQIGIESCKYDARTSENRNIPESEFEEFHGPGVINLVHKTPTGKVLAYEAKGGTSQCKGDQGTMKNLTKESKKMENSRFNSRKKLPGELAGIQKKRVAEEKKRRQKVGKDVRTAIANKNVTFKTVRGYKDKTKKPKVEKMVQ